MITITVLKPPSRLPLGIAGADLFKLETLMQLSRYNTTIQIAEQTFVRVTVCNLKSYRKRNLRINIVTR